jgi:hypothetical protein
VSTVTPEQEEQVRRALRATAQADQPAKMPREVADRLDEVLADLTGPMGRSKDHVGTGHDELAARRKRRWPNVIVAAAAVAVIAAAGAAVATGGFGSLSGQGDSTNAEKAASSRTSSKADDNTDGKADEKAGSAPSSAPSGGGRRGLTEKSGPGALPLLHTSTLSADVQALLRARRGVGNLQAPRALPEAPADCARPFTGRGASLFVVRLDGRPATLVVGPARDGERRARIYSCDGAGSPLASVSVHSR